MKIDELIPLHNAIRKPKRVKEFEYRLRMGHILRGIETPIVISRIYETNFYWDHEVNDKVYTDSFYIHDGHHRIYAAWLCGIEELMPCEYTIQDMSYSMYQDLAPQVGWVTPLDIRTHVRKPDFYGFKNEALTIYNQGKLNERNYKDYGECRQYVENHIDMYQEDRKVWKVGDMTYE